MGWDLTLNVSDRSIEGPSLGRGFFYEIVWGRLFDLDAILTDEEREILEPNESGKVVLGGKKRLTAWDWFKILRNMKLSLFGSKRGFGHVGAVFDHMLDISEAVEDRERDPLLLKKVLEKLQRHLIDHAADLPHVHYVFRDPERTEQVTYITIDGIEYEIDGAVEDAYEPEDYETYRNKIELRTRYTSPTDRMLIDVLPQITIDELVYYTRTLSIAEYYADQFLVTFDFLDEAARLGKKVLWEYH